MAGIKLTTGGTVNNTNTFTGYDYGIEIYGGVGKVANSGSITATAKFGFGVILENGGSVTNKSGGSITASGSGGYGVELQDGGSVTNASGATISGLGSGLVVEGATGTISNSGSILCANYDAIQMKDGGTITNTATGIITGGYRAIYIGGGVGHVTNAGKISAGTQGGVKMTAGGTLINTGTVDGDVHILAGAGTVTNSGTVGGVYLTGGGTITNKAGATIATSFESGVLLGYNGSIFSGGGKLFNGVNADVSGYSGVYAGESVASVSNLGSITGTKFTKSSVAGVLRTFGDGVSLNAGGSVDNETGGSITGVRNGVYIKGSVGKVANAVNAIISGVYDGVQIEGVAGTVMNSGSVAASKDTGVYLGDGGSVTNSATGTIGGADNAIVISGGVGNVTNAGTCSNRVYLRAGGTVTNTGNIHTDNQYAAIYIRGASGKITNSGTLVGDAALGSGGTIVNSVGATITGTDAGGWLGGGGMLLNAAKATITGKSGVYAFGAAASVTNSGSITGTTHAQFNTSFFGDGVSLNDGGSVTNKGGGTIKGVRYGVYVRNGAGTITNAGTITGATVAIEFAGAGANSLTLETGSVLNGSVVGSTAAGATNALVLEGAGWAYNAFLHFDTLSVEATGIWRLGGAVAIGVTTVSTGTLAVLGALTTAMTADALTTVTIGGGHTLTLNGASTLSGTTEGSGSLALTAGATTIADGATIAVGRWSIMGATASATIDEQLGYSGVFIAGSGAHIDMTVSGDFFGLGGTAVFSGATLTGSETLFDGSTTQVSGLTVEGGAGFSNDFSLTQTGLVTLAGSAGLDNLGSSATWNITDNTGIALASGSSTALSFFNDGGLFEKTGGAGVSVIAPAFNNGGQVLASSGALAFKGAVNGTGSDTISGAAALAFGSTVADTQTIDFTGAGGALDLGSPAGFSGVISGFDTVGSNDSVTLLGSWKITGYTQTSSNEGTLTLTDKGLTASLVFDGSYTQARFDPLVGSGHTTITYS